MRIIAGEFRSRKLLAPDGLTTRPMPDRVRESIFSMLGERIKDAAVVDLFAGTGSMGLEALSRGARTCVFFERDRGAVDALRRNIETLGVERRTQVVMGDALGMSAPARCPRPIDLIVMDPPYPLVREPIGWERVKAQASLLAGLLADDGFLLLRTPYPHNIESPLLPGTEPGAEGVEGADPNAAAPGAVPAVPAAPAPLPRALRPRKYRRDRQRWEDNPQAENFQEMRRGGAGAGGGSRFSNVPRTEPKKVEVESDDDGVEDGTDQVEVTDNPLATPGILKTPADHSIPGCRGPESHAYGKTVVHWYMRMRETAGDQAAEPGN